MAIINLQRSMHEAGRIRIGEQVPTGNGNRTRPAKLSTFRFTSGSQVKIKALADRYGGDVQPFDNGGLSQWQVTTNAAALSVVVPPTDMAFTQWLELWSGGGCQRRCDGVRETLQDRECICGPDPEDRECKPTTRLSVMLAEQRGMGLWRIETHGYYAASELLAAVEFVQQAAGRGMILPAVLRLDQRKVVRGGKTHKFAVPTLDVDLPMREIAARNSQALGGVAAALEAGANGEGGEPVAALAQGDPGGPLTPVPLDEHAEQGPDDAAGQMDAHAAQAAQGPKRTKRSAAPVRGPGLAPRTVGQAGGADREAEPVGDDVEPETTVEDEVDDESGMPTTPPDEDDGETSADPDDQERRATRPQPANELEALRAELADVERLVRDNVKLKAPYSERHIPRALQQQVIIRCKEMFGDDDSARHALIKAATDRTASSRGIRNNERVHVMAALLMLRLRVAELDVADQRIVIPGDPEPLRVRGPFDYDAVLPALAQAVVEAEVEAAEGGDQS